MEKVYPKRVAVNLTDRMYQELDDISKEVGATKAEIARYLIRQLLNLYESDEKKTIRMLNNAMVGGMRW